MHQNQLVNLFASLNTNQSLLGILIEEAQWPLCVGLKWFITLARILAWCSWARHFDTLTVPSNLKDRLASDRQNAATCNQMASGLWG